MGSWRRFWSHHPGRSITTAIWRRHSRNHFSQWQCGFETECRLHYLWKLCYYWLRGLRRKGSCKCNSNGGKKSSNRRNITSVHVNPDTLEHSRVNPDCHSTVTLSACSSNGNKFDDRVSVANCSDLIKMIGRSVSTWIGPQMSLPLLECAGMWMGKNAPR